MTRVIDHIAEFAVATSYGDLPPGASSMVVDAITDAYGVGVAGSQEDAATAVLRVIATSPGSLPIPLLGTDLTSSELDASLYLTAVVLILLQAAWTLLEVVFSHMRPAGATQ